MKRTVLYDHHVQLAAQMTDFGGFEMPLRYVGDKVEHLAVRQNVGIFDVSHMGEISLQGPSALLAADTLLSNDIGRLKDGQAAYACLLNERGTIIDDVVAYRCSAERVFICVNAANRDKDYSWIKQALAPQFSSAVLTISDESDMFGQIAIQGPAAIKVMDTLVAEDLNGIARYHFIDSALDLGSGHEVKTMIARTGYTGEDGFEVFLPTHETPALWDRLLEHGKSFGLMPCGLGSRDTLRLEAGMCLYGNDIDETTTPLEAGLSWTVRFDKGVGFIGRNALSKMRSEGLTRRLRGLKLIDKGIARHGHEVLSESGHRVGVVTSGTFAPFLNCAISLAYIDTPHDQIGNLVFINIRGKKAQAQIVKLPFYARR